MLSVNVIFAGRFGTALTPLDQETAATLPVKFYRYLIGDKADNGEESPASLNYTINTQYEC